MAICEMTKANGTDPEFLALKDIPCSELIQNTHILMSGLIEGSFLKELRDGSTPPPRNLFEKSEDMQVAVTGCEEGCTTSGISNCVWKCGSAVSVCYAAFWSWACANAVYKCAKVANSCCYCAAYLGWIGCDQCWY